VACPNDDVVWAGDVTLEDGTTKTAAGARDEDNRRRHDNVGALSMQEGGCVLNCRLWVVGDYIV
jgi:hypothetical protein